MLQNDVQRSACRVQAHGSDPVLLHVVDICGMRGISILEMCATSVDVRCCACVGAGERSKRLPSDESDPKFIVTIFCL
jgi:hypothetical protein